MSDTIRKVADAIEWQMAQDENNPDDLARAAIEAIREPTDGMLGVGERYFEDWDCKPHLLRDLKEAWAAMIDAAIQTTGEPK